VASLGVRVRRGTHAYGAAMALPEATVEVPFWVEATAIVTGSMSGSLRAIRERLDLSGVAALAVAAGLGGGLIRDTLLQAGTPVAFTERWFLPIALIAAAVTLVLTPVVRHVTRLTFVVDAPSMGLYSIIGADKALLFGLPPVGAILVGILSGTGGSLLADLAVGVPPSLFRPGKLRGVAAAAGVTVFVIGTEVSENRVAWFIAGVVIVTALRLASLTLGWGVGPAENLSGLSEQMLRAIPVPSVPETIRPRRILGRVHRTAPMTPPPAPPAPSGEARSEPGDDGSLPSGA